MKRMGFEGILLWGAAGATAATPLSIARDMGYRFEPTEADVSDRGSKIELTDVAMVKFAMDFEINNQDTDPFIAALRIAAATGGAIALRTRDKTAGWGVDGDFIVGDDESQPLKDAQRLRVVCKPTDKAGRLPVWG
ncbi:MAG TPA: hypothetical protein VJ809_00995 [Pirellulales bacterium]|nr:hypothetical protein [Pirellulales bacterium]